MAAGLVLALVACEGGERAGAPPQGAGAGAAADTVGAAAPELPGERTVRVWYAREERPVAVERRVEETAPGAALQALVAGPTAAERAAGLSSWFSDSTRDVIREVRLEDGFLVADFTGLPALIPGASSSAGSGALLQGLDSTAFQFPAVDSVEYRLDGSCEAFWEWLQRDCRVVRRDGGEGS